MDNNTNNNTTTEKPTPEQISKALIYKMGLAGAEVAGKTYDKLGGSDTDANHAAVIAACCFIGGIASGAQAYVKAKEGEADLGIEITPELFAECAERAAKLTVAHYEEWKNPSPGDLAKRMADIIMGKDTAANS